MANPRVTRDALHVARQLGASPKEIKAMIEAGIVESGMENLRHGDRDSQGFLQQRPSQGWGSVAQVTNVKHAAESFLSRARAANRPGQSAGQLAQAVQRSAFPGRYDAVAAAAAHIVAQGTGGAGSPTGGAPPATGGGTAQAADPAAQHRAFYAQWLAKRDPNNILLKVGALDPNAPTTKTVNLPGVTPETPGTPSPSGRGKVTYASTANREGVKMQAPIKGFLKRVSALSGRPVSVGTGTNHNQFVAGSNRQSDHWEGNAGDLPVPVDSKQGDLLAAHALQAAGMPWGQAIREAKKGGVWNLNYHGKRVQVLWKTMVGGNHHNHVHVGVVG